MRFIIIMIFILTGCENKPELIKDTKNTKVENEKAKLIFNSCKRCHGERAELHALKVSDIIANYSKNEIVKALVQYKKGKRDKHRFGHLMKSIVKDLSSDEIRILANYISRIKEEN